VMTLPLWGIVAAALFILFVGILDDIRELSWKAQLLSQFLLASAAFCMGIRLLSLSSPFGGTIFFDAPEYVFPSFVLTVAWMLFIMNAVNWADGIDGLCGGVAFIGFLAILFLSLKPEVNQPPVGLLAAALAGGSLGFLVFNFHPAKILAGTAGSWFLGFMLAVLAIFAGTKIATALLVLALPALDAVWVVFDRWRSGVSVFQADARHLHYRLRELGWSQVRITLFFYAVTLAIAVVALNTRSLGKFVTIVLVTAIALAVFLWVERKIKLERIRRGIV
jgi:UDP-GlcNAc:undecaprenyl-phosphate GlcNAc-1-phosphate transferase